MAQQWNQEKQLLEKRERNALQTVDMLQQQIKQLSYQQSNDYGGMTEANPEKTNDKNINLPEIVESKPRQQDGDNQLKP